MKKIITILAMSLSSLSYGQVGAVGTDFTATDINGTSHNLYSLLNDGYVVILDVSATWCGPCFGFHSEHFLEEIEAVYGASGTNKVRVLFYEGDAETDASDLAGAQPSHGLSIGSQGDWITGVTYPIINESPVTLNLSNYAPLGYPTVNVICPSTKIILADLFDNWGGSDHAADLAAMKVVIDAAIVSCYVADASISEKSLSDSKLYPNPTTGALNLKFNSSKAEELNISVSNIIGQTLYTGTMTVNNGENVKSFDFGTFKTGSYFFHIENAEGITSIQQFQIK